MEKSDLWWWRMKRLVTEWGGQTVSSSGEIATDHPSFETSILHELQLCNATQT